VIRWLLDFMGRADKVATDAALHFEWGHLPRGTGGLLLVLAAVASVALTLWLYRREGSANKSRKAFLAGIRLCVLACVLLLFLEPRVAVDRTRVLPGQTIVLWDASISMSLADRYQDPVLRAAMAKAAGLRDAADLSALTRHELAWRIVAEAQLFDQLSPADAPLSERNELRVYAFGDKASALPTPYTKDAAAPTAPATDLAGALRQALAETGGRNVAAVIAVTDGRVNKGEGAAGVIAALEARRIPFYALGLGDPILPKNLEVAEPAVPPRVILGDPVVIEATAKARGYAGVDLDVVLQVAPAAGGKPQELERRPWTPPQGTEASKVVVFRNHKPEKAGDFVYTVRLATRQPQPAGEEKVTEDDSKSAPVKVTEETTRVLLVAGGPAVEYHFLRTRLTREKAAKVSIWLQSAVEGFKQPGNVRIKELPTTLEALREYDCVVLLDPNPVGFSVETAQALKDFVANEHGGLLYIPGPKYSGSFLHRAELKPLRDLLPIVPGDLMDFTNGAATRRAPLKATLDGGDHPATRIAADPELCRTLWSRLPGPFFSFPVRREKAGALVLVRHDVESAGNTATREGRPLVVAHFFQGGPVIFQGTDETWRWRSVAPEVYDRYWVGLMRFLIQGRLEGGRKRVELLTDKQVYHLGEPVRVRAQAFDPSYRPLLAEELVARTKIGEDEADLNLRPLAKRPGWYEGSFLPPRPGVLEVALRLPDDDPGKPPESVQLSVRHSDVEKTRSLSLNAELLEGIAAATSGALVAPLDLASLPEKIPLRTEELTVAEPPIALWDGWHTVILLCLLLGIEWTVRKRSKMV
jgi:hypothetical protein